VAQLSTLGGMTIMCRFGVLLLGLVLTTGCEMVYVVPPANGRVVDARSHQPLAQADVTRIHADAPAKTKTDAKGYFRFRVGDTCRLRWETQFSYQRRIASRRRVITPLRRIFFMVFGRTKVA